MDDRVRITIELDRSEHDALAAIASDQEMSLDHLAADALRARIDLERGWEAAVREGLDDIEAGREISHEEYLAHAAERRRRWLADRAA